MWKDIVKKKIKSAEELKKDYGIGSAHDLTIKARIAEWVKKVWDFLDEDVPFSIPESRLVKEFGCSNINQYVKKQLKKRGVKLKIVKPVHGHGVKRRYYLVYKIDNRVL